MLYFRSVALRLVAGHGGMFGCLQRGFRYAVQQRRYRGAS
jgi:hypothetical protein